MGGKSKKTVIGYWYKWLAHFLFSQRVDAVLELRAGGKTMWAGRVTENQRISVNKPDLFGGIKNAGGQGGVVTDIDLQFGRDDQGPNDYLGLLGPKQTGHRRKFGIVIRGGKFGAFNSQPQTVAAKVERIVTDWQGDECWYPEKAIIPMSADTVVQASNAVWDYQISAAEAHPGDVTAADIPEGGWSSGEGPFAGGTLESTGNTNWPINTVLWCRRIISIPGSVGQVLRVRAENGCVVFVNGTFVGAVNQANDDIDGNQDNQFTFPLSAGQSYELAVKAFDEHNPSANSGTQLIIEVVTGGLNAMNPAHILHDNIVHRFNMGEPVGAINDASFRAAADRFFSEGFGLCTVRDPDQETPKQFENRICALVGAQVNQSRTDGLYYLDVIRSVTDAELVDLPVISSDDILEFDQQPNVIAEADNVFIGKWRDPQTKSDRATRPLVSQAALRASGVRSEVVKEYYEIPTEELVLRVIERDMNMATLPRSQFKLKCNRRVRGLRPGQPFRLQVPEEGIADMVCNLAKITHGTSTKGAVSIEALQNVFALSAASYIETDPPDWQAPDNSPLPSAAQAAIEAPYVELVALLPASDLADLPQDAGYVAALAARTPAGPAPTMTGDSAGLMASPSAGGSAHACRRVPASSRRARACRPPAASSSPGRPPSCRIRHAARR